MENRSCLGTILKLVLMYFIIKWSFVLFGFIISALGFILSAIAFVVFFFASLRFANRLTDKLLGRHRLKDY